MAEDASRTDACDEDLIRATLGGETQAFGAVVERYWAMVFGLALARVGDLGEAEDIAQESFLKAFAHLRSLRDPARFAGWLVKIAVQQSSDSIRRRTRRSAALGGPAAPAERLDDLPAYSPNPGLTDAQVQLVQGAVGRLPAKLQNLVILRFMGGLSAVQIAGQLGRRPGTVRVWLHRAYEILRRDLSPLLEEVGSP